MMTPWNDVAVEAIDYELVWLGSSVRPELGSFADAHHVTTPVWRLVSGYLMLTADGVALEVSSHGHPVATMLPGSHRLRVTIPSPTVVTGQVAVAESGVALVADAGTTWAVEGNQLTAQSLGTWGVTLVHGPARSKVDARLDLLASLQRVGGRRG